MVTSPVQSAGTVYVTVVTAGGTTAASPSVEFVVAAPSFTLSSPASVTIAAGQTVSIQWVAASVPNGSTISLAYDTTTNWGNPKWIEVDGVAAADGSGAFSWNTTGLAAGTYYIAGNM